MVFDVAPEDVARIRRLSHVESRPYSITIRITRIEGERPAGCLLALLVDVVGQHGAVDRAAVVEVVTWCMSCHVSQAVGRVVDGVVVHVGEW